MAQTAANPYSLNYQVGIELERELNILSNNNKLTHSPTAPNNFTLKDPQVIVRYNFRQLEAMHV